MTIYSTNLQNALSHALYLIRKCSLITASNGNFSVAWCSIRGVDPTVSLSLQD